MTNVKQTVNLGCPILLYVNGLLVHPAALVAEFSPVMPTRVKIAVREGPLLPPPIHSALAVWKVGGYKLTDAPVIFVILPVPTGPNQVVSAMGEITGFAFIEIGEHGNPRPADEEVTIP